MSAIFADPMPLRFHPHSNSFAPKWTIPWNSILRAIQAKIFSTSYSKLPPNNAPWFPTPPDALTSDSGWQLEKNKTFLQKTCQILKERGVRSSLFVDPLSWNLKETKALKEISPSRIELYTESFATAFGTPQLPQTLALYSSLAQLSKELGIGINAGHDLNQENLSTLIQAIPSIEEVSIGHALICEALFEGMEVTINNYLGILGWNKSKEEGARETPHKPLGQKNEMGQKNERGEEITTPWEKRP